MNIQAVLTKELLYSFIDQFLEPGTKTSHGLLHREEEEVLYASCRFAISNKFFLKLREKKLCSLAMWIGENDNMPLTDKRHFSLTVFEVVGSSFTVYKKIEPNCPLLFSPIVKYTHKTYSDSWIGSVLDEIKPSQNVVIDRLIKNGVDTQLHFCDSECSLILN